MVQGPNVGMVAAALGWLAPASGFAATIQPHAAVRGSEVSRVEVRAAGKTWRGAAWDDLDRARVDPGSYEIRFDADGGSLGAHVQLPHCAGRARITVDGRGVTAPAGPALVALPPGTHDIRITVSVSNYERRIACGDRPRVGEAASSVEGLGMLTFDSPAWVRGGGMAVVYVPPRHDVRAPAALLVGLHPWNGTMWTYAAYAELLRAAAALDVVLLLPSGLGNSLYTAEAEEEVMRAIAAVSGVIAIDPRAVTIWGASMGGAGAATIGLHRPDRFAAVVSFFGDSKYDTTTYVRAILPDEAAAHLVNALDVADNARHVPVWLVHGEQDRTCPIQQSEMLARALADRGFRVRFDRVPGEGHSGALVARFLPEVVFAAATARVPEDVTRVTFRSVRPSDTRAYGLTLVRRAATGDAFVDVERSDGVVHLRRAEGVRSVLLARGALGTSPERAPPPIEGGAQAGVDVRWEARP
ncbi:MAG TPA: prolyl oligopeptidase family serine peptidase [Polyangiaceae bacterium]|nr:prolyl oligopeptidase family serine peptidase [Polyangiaceae bacterium]